jgi:hypothetical protein
MAGEDDEGVCDVELSVKGRLVTVGGGKKERKAYLVVLVHGLGCGQGAAALGVDPCTTYHESLP